MHNFFDQVRADGRLASWIERHYGHNEGVTQIHSQTFLEAVDDKLPKYRNMIEQVAREYDLDWRLLAAVAYQESYWNPNALSPTGVRGMMMLTMNTAKEMGIANRSDARQSLEGGAKYLQYMRQRIPKQITEPDRSWFALASYNVGFGHLRDARILVARAGGNPDRWNDVKEYLPLLRKPEYYKTVNHGFARGDEPVRYVQNIRHYYSLLSWQEINKVRPDIRQKVADYVPKALIDALPAL
jgi:membrane-bound lytic murein transglycosylase F